MDRFRGVFEMKSSVGGGQLKWASRTTPTTISRRSEDSMSSMFDCQKPMASLMLLKYMAPVRVYPPPRPNMSGLR